MDLYDWICSFINLERGLGGKPASRAEEHFKLDRMEILAELAEHPENSAPVIHIAGSKGKGSITAMLASILEAAGKKPARYMSPHVSDWRERICRGNSFFPEDVYAQAGAELRDIYGRYIRQYKELEAPTFFELMTLLFFLCARQGRCDIMVIETGLGGRLDATNIVDPAVSVITVIEKEHTEYLGNTLEAIAAEKGGIIKPARPVVVAEQSGAALAVLEKIAAERGAPFFYLPRYVEITDLRIHRDGTDFFLTAGVPAGEAGRSLFESELFVPIPGRVQAGNAALAVLAALALEDRCGAYDFAAFTMRGLRRVSLPGRFERLGENPVLISDGAHTPASVEQCAETFCSLYGEGGILLFGCAADKDAGTLAPILVRRFIRCIITTPGKFRASDPQGTYAAFTKTAETAGIRTAISLIPDTPAAVREAFRLAKEMKLPVLGCGSFYLAAEIRKIIFTDTTLFLYH
jgi:dihydrofolate synthase/folylpolyglutamate synthase